MATEVTKIVDPGEGAGHDYHSLSLWEAGEQGDLTGVRDEIAVAKCRATDGDADTTNIIINGWTTSATQYIKIWTDPAEGYRHDGKWNIDKYRIDYTHSAWTYPLTIDASVQHIRFEGLQVGLNGVISTQQSWVVFGFNSLTTTSDYRISCCIIRNTATITDPNWSIGCLSANLAKIWNTIIYGAVKTGTGAVAYGILSGGWNGARTSYFYSLTVYGCASHGIVQAGDNTIVAKNCISYNNGVDWANSFTATDCLSKDNTSPDANHRGKTLTFVNTTAGSEDLHLVAGDTDAIDKGTDTSGDAAPLNFIDDIDGVTRSGTWDIGADEYVAAGGLSISVSETLSMAEALD